MTQDQMEAFQILDARGLHAVRLPWGADTPVPGLILFVDAGHTQLLMVQGDGTTIDLLKVHALAEDCVRNWRKDDPMNLPKFVGDFKRLVPLAEALTGAPAAGKPLETAP